MANVKKMPVVAYGSALAINRAKGLLAVEFTFRAQTDRGGHELGGRLSILPYFEHTDRDETTDAVLEDVVGSKPKASAPRVGF